MAKRAPVGRPEKGQTTLVVTSLVAVVIVDRTQISQLSFRLQQVCEGAKTGLGSTLHMLGEAVRARQYDIYSEREGRAATNLGVLSQCQLGGDGPQLLQQVRRITEFGRDVSSGLWSDPTALDLFDVGLRDIGSLLQYVWLPTDALARTLELVGDLEALGYSL